MAITALRVLFFQKNTSWRFLALRKDTRAMLMPRKLQATRVFRRKASVKKILYVVARQ
jgi:hypothetical protein